MLKCELTRRNFLSGAASTTLAACAAPSLSAGTALGAATESVAPGSQRLSLERLQKWESLRYGMFIHFGMSTFLNMDGATGNEPAATYAPDRLDVDQWVSVARDAGMKYIVLTAKHLSGHCLWPSKHTDYTVANSGNKTNVIEAFCKACEKRGILPGIYYCSWDQHHRFGSKTAYDEKVEDSAWKEMCEIPKSQDRLPPFTTSLYQNFQTAQLTELLTQFGPISETWIDCGSLLGRGYRTFLYHHLAGLQPETVIMMNTLPNLLAGSASDRDFFMASAWPSDLLTLERSSPPAGGYRPWQELEGKKYYLPAEVCDTLNELWFWNTNAKPRSDEFLLQLFNKCRAGGTNLLLDVPPDTHGVIPGEFVAALMRLRKNAGV